MDRLITVITSVGVKQGRCRDCRDPILFAMRASRPGHPAKLLPWNRPRPWPLSTTRNDETGLVCEVWPASALHFTTCRLKRDRPTKRPRAHA